eukprot:gene12100-8324_t
MLGIEGKTFPERQTRYDHSFACMVGLNRRFDVPLPFFFVSVRQVVCLNITAHVIFCPKRKSIPYESIRKVTIVEVSKKYINQHHAGKIRPFLSLLFSNLESSEAIKKVQEELSSQKFATFSELHLRVSEIIKPYEPYGGGFERLRVQLCKDSASTPDLQKGVEVMMEICKNKLKEYNNCENDQINNILPFVRNSSKILVHGSGHLLALAIAYSIQEQEGVHFYISEGLPKTEKCPEGSAVELIKKAKNTPEGATLGSKIAQSCTIIPDSAVGAVLGIVDFVMMGSYCVTEHGGLIHSTGSLQVATLASSRNVPCYVLCETFKFSHVFPLSTEDLKQPARDCPVVPLVEFVPPSLVTLIFSEDSIMPPSAVAGEMFRLYTAPSAVSKTKKWSPLLMRWCICNFCYAQSESLLLLPFPYSFFFLLLLFNCCCVETAMPCNCGREVGSHDHMGDGFAKDGCFGVGAPINECVDLTGIQAWNSINSAEEAQRLFDPTKKDNSKAIVSDDDPEILFSVPLSSLCKIRGVSIQGPCSDYAPRAVKIFANQPDICGFDSVRRLKPQEELQLAQTSTDDRIIYRLNPMKFNSVGCLAFHFEHSYGDEETHIIRIELFGENTGVSTNQKLATNVNYELRPNPADHPVKDENRPFVSLC